MLRVAKKSDVTRILKEKNLGNLQEGTFSWKRKVGNCYDLSNNIA